MDDFVNRQFVCPYHGRIREQYITTMKTCGQCMEERGTDCGSSTLLLREPYEGHHPRWQFDCGRCKFAWCCGPTCMCGLRAPLEVLEPTPKWRMDEVKLALKIWRKHRRRH